MGRGDVIARCSKEDLRNTKHENSMDTLCPGKTTQLSAPRGKYKNALASLFPTLTFVTMVKSSIMSSEKVYSGELLLEHPVTVLHCLVSDISVIFQEGKKANQQVSYRNKI